MLYSCKFLLLPVILIIYWSTQPCTSQTTAAMAAGPKTALIFGGNGFMGSETVSLLLEDNFKVTCLSRGNWYWDSERRIKPRVHHIQCDRKKPLEECEELIDNLQNDKIFDVVIDFSGYKPNAVSNALDLLANKTELYIFISTDSVYEVSVDKKQTGSNKEEDAIRPDSVDEREELNRRDSYGHRKLECEQVIRERLGRRGTASYVILRLPDVIGQRDTTNRWFPYQLWAQFYHRIGRPFIIPTNLQNLSTSYVYVKDVANVVLKVVKEKDKIKNQVFNVALEESLTLVQFLSRLCEELEIKGFQFDYVSEQSGFSLFPSVTRGSIDISKIKRILQWTPTEWKDVFEETTEFYKSALVRFPNERQDAVETLLADVVPSTNKDIFLNTLKAELQLLVTQNMDFPPEKKKIEL